MTLAVTRGAILGTCVPAPSGGPPGVQPAGRSAISAARAPGLGTSPSPEDPENIWIPAQAHEPAIAGLPGRCLKPCKNRVFVSGWHGLCYCYNPDGGSIDKRWSGDVLQPAGRDVLE